MLKILLTLLLCAASAAQAGEAFRFPVVRDKFLRDESGQLTIDDEGITYRSNNGKTSLQFPYARHPESRSVTAELDSTAYL